METSAFGAVDLHSNPSNRRSRDRRRFALLGESFTLADVVVSLSTHPWLMAPIKRAALPAAQGHCDRSGARPGFRLHGRHGMPCVATGGGKQPARRHAEQLADAI